jgi:putative NADH-flavin reductase
MKKIIVYGANGRTGRMVVKYALQAGYSVTAYIREDDYYLSHPSLTVVRGNALDKEQAINAMKGHDVVISALGTNQINGPAVNLMSDGMKIFVEGMNKWGIKRVLAVGGLAVLQLNDVMQMIDKPDYPAEYKNVGDGHNKVYKVLRETNLEWTFVCCPNIVDGERTGKYNTKKDYPAEGQFQIFTGDLADFILREMEKNDYLKARVGIANIN